MELQEIQAKLESMGVPVVFDDVSEEYPIAHLTVTVDKDLDVQLLYIPGLEEELPEVRLLQIYFLLPMEIDPSALDEVRRILPHVNRNLPLMAFNLDEMGGFIYFRHVLMLAQEGSQSDLSLIFNAISLSHFLIDQFGPVLDKVAAAEMTSSEVLETAAQDPD